MAIAGKVAITLSTENGGAWSSDVTYERLVAVKHNNNLYISRKTVANVEPPNDEFWFLALEGFGGDDVESILQAIENIINGTTQVGNAKTLDGHGAEYFFPKSGGEINGNVTMKIDDATQALIYGLDTPNRKIEVAVLPNGSFGISDSTNDKWIFTSSLEGSNVLDGTATGNLPLTGGELKGTTNNTILKFNPTVSVGQAVLLEFLANGSSYGHIGFNNVNNLILRTSDGNFKELLHTGNKPTGTYMGNGDATQRTINTGGIGNDLLFSAGDEIGIVGYHCGVIFNAGLKQILYYTAEELNFRNGILTIATDSAYVNVNGGVYGYRVL